MAGSPDLAPILEMLNATRASARERQGEIERKIRAEARKLRQGDAAGQCDRPSSKTSRFCWTCAAFAQMSPCRRIIGLGSPEECHDRPVEALLCLEC